MTESVRTVSESYCAPDADIILVSKEFVQSSLELTAIPPADFWGIAITPTPSANRIFLARPYFATSSTSPKAKPTSRIQPKSTEKPQDASRRRSSWYRRTER